MAISLVKLVIRLETLMPTTTPYPAYPSRTSTPIIKTITGKVRRIMLPIAIFSIFVNLLILTVPIYMLQIYDRVLTSRNATTLIMLTLIAAVLIAVGSFLMHMRSRIEVRLGLQLEQQLSRPAFAAELGQALHPGEATTSSAKDLDELRRFLSGKGLTGLFDMPWIPLFILAIFFLHPLLGLTATGGAVAVLVVNLLTYLVLRGHSEANDTNDADNFLKNSQRHSDVINAMGMTNALNDEWQLRRGEAATDVVQANDIHSRSQSVINFLRQFTQIGMLGVGAYLAIRDIITPGVIVAGSIICSRALTPISRVLTTVERARLARQAYARLLGACAEASDTVPSQRRHGARTLGHLAVDDISVTAIDRSQAILKAISFELQAGHSLGVVGPSGAGKSTLVRVLIGVLPPNSGRVLVGGHEISPTTMAWLGVHIGYLPQKIALFDGTVGQNIARFRSDDIDLMVDAANRIGLHDIVNSLPSGYDTPIVTAAKQLTPSQLRGIGLARAFYGDPALLVLDGPDTGLDEAGNAALMEAIRQRQQEGRTIVIVSDRPSMIRELDRLLVLWNGKAEGLVKPERFLDRMGQLGLIGSSQSVPESRQQRG